MISGACSESKAVVMAFAAAGFPVVVAVVVVVREERPGEAPALPLLSGRCCTSVAPRVVSCVGKEEEEDETTAVTPCESGGLDCSSAPACCGCFSLSPVAVFFLDVARVFGSMSPPLVLLVVLEDLPTFDFLGIF